MAHTIDIRTRPMWHPTRGLGWGAMVPMEKGDERAGTSPGRHLLTAWHEHRLTAKAEAFHVAKRRWLGVGVSIAVDGVEVAA